MLVQRRRHFIIVLRSFFNEYFKGHILENLNKVIRNYSHFQSGVPKSRDCNTARVKDSWIWLVSPVSSPQRDVQRRDLKSKTQKVFKCAHIGRRISLETGRNVTLRRNNGSFLFTGLPDFLNILLVQNPLADWLATHRLTKIEHDRCKFKTQCQNVPGIQTKIWSSSFIACVL